MEDNTGEIKLKDYKKIWSKFCFLDESGSLNPKTAPYFTIGLIKCSQPYYSYTVYKDGEYFKKEFKSDTWNAYEQISIRLSNAALSQNEILILIADHINVPKRVRYEVNVKRKINQHANRLAMAGVCRFDSKGNDLIQIVDLFIGAINYDLKMSTGIVKEFIDGYKNRQFNIFVDKDIKQKIL
ncbi:DUF3800 domain-containing protein [Patescibacteria group bacterium]|nr:DUF3800 domain-containing protein [Patescibacteria group bacterium]